MDPPPVQCISVALCAFNCYLSFFSLLLYVMVCSTNGFFLSITTSTYFMFIVAFLVHTMNASMKYVNTQFYELGRHLFAISKWYFDEDPQSKDIRLKQAWRSLNIYIHSRLSSSRWQSRNLFSSYLANTSSFKIEK